ncbi:hypothetical protein SLI_5781 [Streptomyces lividans 1326]|uniref:Uncharacterized protein n=1 Tax=Streptomyces lividans 1326 TaxID=1200984 RepID=A0A7U9DUU1_STRLI|nr:hypothetical protein SLI_5781 [Streptomyces lividans 1326]
MSGGGEAKVRLGGPTREGHDRWSAGRSARRHSRWGPSDWGACR